MEKKVTLTERGRDKVHEGIRSESVSPTKNEFAIASTNLLCIGHGLPLLGLRVDTCIFTGIFMIMDLGRH